jgi:DNA-binding NarL/FixJ family response regulator
MDVVLVDIRLPDGSGLELISEYTTAADGPAWIVLSSFETPQYLAAALTLGAGGYLLKTAPIADVVETIRRVAAGGSAFTRSQLRTAHESGAFRLAPLERKIVQGLVTGRSNDEIARELGVARKTVEAHLTRLFELFEVTSRTELALRAEREGWLDLPH